MGASGHQPLAIDIHHQQLPRAQHLPEAAVGVDDPMQVLPDAGGLVGGDLVEPAVDGALVGETAAEPGLQRGVGPQPGVARGDPLEAGGQAGEQGEHALLGAVGGAAPGGVAQGQVGPGVGQAQGLGLAQEAFDENDAETTGGLW
jgi:hypothetical protein